MTRVDFGRMTALIAAGALLCAGAPAAELPASAPKAGARGAVASAKAPPRCDVGGVQGVMTPAGVCLKMSGYVSAGVWGRSVK